jgi:hypothetical protein
MAFVTVLVHELVNYFKISIINYEVFISLIKRVIFSYISHCENNNNKLFFTGKVGLDISSKKNFFDSIKVTGALFKDKDLKDIGVSKNFVSGSNTGISGPNTRTFRDGLRDDFKSKVSRKLI